MKIDLAGNTAIVSGSTADIASRSQEALQALAPAS